MDSFRFGSWKDFSLGWWNALTSAWFPASAILKVWHRGSNFVLVYAIVHEKSGMHIRESWPSCPWQYFRSFDRGIVILSVFMAPHRVVLPTSRNKCHWKLLTSMTIFSKFWSRDRYPICIHGSPPCCFTYIAEQVSLEVVDMFLGAGGPWPVISRTQA